MEETKKEITVINKENVTKSGISQKENNYDFTPTETNRDLVVSTNSDKTLSTGYDNCIVIDKQELNSAYVNDRVNEEIEAKVDFNKTERIPVKNSILLNPIFYSAVCGLLAAFIGWAIFEPFVPPILGEQEYILDLMVIAICLFVGSSLSSIDSLMSGNFKKTLKLAAKGLAIASLVSLGVYYIADKTYHLLIKYSVNFFIFLFPILKELKAARIIHNVLLIASRSPVWSFLGAGIGVVPGITNKSNKLAVNGLVGGLIGGYIGGFLFDPICEIVRNSGTTGGLSRGVGFAILGLMIGVFTGLIENVAKDVWITMKSGPLRGKQFVIYHNPTIIGSSPKSDIYIFKDPNVMPVHAKILKKGTKYEIIDESRGKGVFVNSKKINGSKILEQNDRIIVGQSILEFHLKDKR